MPTFDAGDFDCVEGRRPPPADSELPYVGVKPDGGMCECPRAEGGAPPAPTWCSRWYYSPLGRAEISRFPDVSQLIPQQTMPLQSVKFVKDKDFAAVVGLTSFDRIAVTFQGVLTIKTVRSLDTERCSRGRALVALILQSQSIT
jgi:hypothetical protein